MGSSLTRLIERIFVKNSAGTTINPATSDIQTDGTQRTGVLGADGSAIASNANPVPTKLPDREKITDLSFVEILSPLGAHTTTWVDISAHEHLDFQVEVETNDAVTGLVEFTDAADPNTTAPGANDIVRPFLQTVGGTGVGGPANAVGFGFHPPMKWCRITATDVTGGQTVKVSTWGFEVPANAAILPIAANITNDFGAMLVQAIEKSEDPGGSYRANRFSGIVNEQSSTSTISASGSFTGSEWTSSRGFTGAAIFIKSDANSVVDGVKIQVSYDSGVTVHDEMERTYDAAPAGRTYKFAIATPGAHIRVKVTAGGSDMTNLILKTFLLASEVEDVSIPLNDVPVGGMVADITKAGIIGKDSGGTWHNQDFSTAGNPQFSIAEVEADVPIKALTTLNIKQEAVTTSSGQLDSPPLANRKTVTIQALTSNTESVWIGHSSSVSTSNGRELPAGDAVDLEIDDTVAVYAIATSGTQNVSVTQVA